MDVITFDSIHFKENRLHVSHLWSVFIVFSMMLIWHVYIKIIIILGLWNTYITSFFHLLLFRCEDSTGPIISMIYALSYFSNSGSHWK